MSQTTFYRKFIQELGYRYKRLKYTGECKDIERFYHSRLIGLNILASLIRLDVQICFFDESTFELLSRPRRSYCLSGVRNIRAVKLYPIRLKLLMLCNFNAVIQYQMTDEASTGELIYEFLKNLQFCLIATRIKPMRIQFFAWTMLQ